MELTNRSRVRRMPERGSNELANIHRILDAAFLAHVGFAVDGQPFVIPTLYGRAGDDLLYLHGSAASRMMRHLETGVAACVTVSIVDGLVLARSAFHHSMNYRSVAVFGTAVKVQSEAEKSEALRVISEHLIRGRWAEVREPAPQELKATTVLAFRIEEASAKVRTGGPKDDPEDMALPVWAGVLPVELIARDPVADTPDREIPESVRRWRTQGRD